MNPEIPKVLTMTDEIFNMVWTAGYQSGLNTGHELYQKLQEGVLKDNDDIEAFVDKRSKELINQDADGIVELIKLKQSMGE